MILYCVLLFLTCGISEGVHFLLLCTANPFMGGSRVGIEGQDNPPENPKNIGVLAILVRILATKLALNVGLSSALQRNAI